MTSLTTTKKVSVGMLARVCKTLFAILLLAVCVGSFIPLVQNAGAQPRQLPYVSISYPAAAAILPATFCVGGITDGGFCENSAISDRIVCTVTFMDANGNTRSISKNCTVDEETDEWDCQISLSSGCHAPPQYAPLSIKAEIFNANWQLLHVSYSDAIYDYASTQSCCN